MLEINWSVSIWTAINFIILLLILKKYAWGPIVDSLEKRKEHISESIEMAARARREAEQKLKSYQQLIEKGRTESREIIQQGQKKAEGIQKEIVEKAKQEAKEIHHRAHQEISHAREQAIEEIKTRTADLSVAIASKILERDIRLEEHRELISKSIRDIGETS